jgi:hypothetical protein
VLRLFSRNPSEINEGVTLGVTPKFELAKAYKYKRFSP